MADPTAATADGDGGSNGDGGDDRSRSSGPNRSGGNGGNGGSHRPNGGDGGEITFVVTGQALVTGGPSGHADGKVRAAATVGARRRGGDTVRLAARPGRDVVVVQIAGGPTLVLHPEDARDLMQAQQAAPPPAAPSRGGDAAPGEPDADGREVDVPAELAWPQSDAGVPGTAATRGTGTTRGLFGRVGVALLEVVTIDRAAELTARKVVRKIDAQVDAGLYKLSRAGLGKLKGTGVKVGDGTTVAAFPGPLLVLVHGTFVETTSTFGKLWALYPGQVGRLFDRYGEDGVYALDHPTLGASPLANALTLVQALPEGARLHLVTHSRGGLVAEALVRVCAAPDATDGDDRFADPAYADHARDLEELRKLVKERGITVERVVRVACPARGTLLASGRLTAYLSVLRWSLELAAIPAVPELLEFLTQVALRRGDPREVPGLEAMIPDSPFVGWLNGPVREAAPGTLRVVAGDLKGDSVGSWVKTLLADAFYWTDNDLVVQTRSMYGGVPRAAGRGGEAGASFLLDRGGSVSHFCYFSNKTTVKAITQALLDDAPADFQPIGPLSWSGEDASGFRAARRTPAEAAVLPALFVLPGILGSNLAVDDRRVWVGWRFFNNLGALAYGRPGVKVTEDGPIERVYDRLIDHLSASHDVRRFGYDWRLPIEQEAGRLADAIVKALDERSQTRKPVRILAHSMGGLVVRTLKLKRPDVWQRLMDSNGARVLMLGTPNGGSWAPMQVLSGDDRFGNLLSFFGGLFDGHEARNVMAAMPGFLQLQAGLVGGTPDLSLRESWEQLAANDLRKALLLQSGWHNTDLQRKAVEWGVPTKAALEAAVTLRRSLDTQAEAQARALEAATRPGADADDRAAAAETAKMLLVVGRAPSTPAGMREGEHGVEYLDERQIGDGRVTLASALLPGVRTWRVEASHGDLPSTKSAFAAYLQLLQTGETTLLERVNVTAGAAVGLRGAPAATAAAAAAAVATAGAVPLERSRPSRLPQGGGAQPPSDVGAMFAELPSSVFEPTADVPALAVKVENGNLKFVRQPLMIGHYASMALTGTEDVIDGLIGEQLTRSLNVGLYPSALGTHQIFLNRLQPPDNPFGMPRPTAVIVVGLGEEDLMRGSELADAVRQATLAYAQHVSEAQGVVATGFELAATLLGSGGTGVSPAQAAQAIASGVHNANQRIARTGTGWPPVTRLTLIELYLDRAAEALHALRLLAAAQPGAFDVESRVRFGTGPLRRPLGLGYRGAPYDFISVQQHRDGAGSRVIEYTLDSRRARSEVRAAKTQSKLVDELVSAGADAFNRETRIGRTLFQLLVPVALEPSMTGTDAVVMQLDGESARIPWEMLDTVAEAGMPPADRRPWAVRTRMIRKLRTERFREAPTMARTDHCVLVIGVPKTDPDKGYPLLPGARHEAEAVATVLGTRAQLDGDALGVVNALLEKPYRIVHITGHGKLRDKASSSGVVLTGDTVVGPSEIESMRSVPELAFINCCYLGNLEGEAATRPHNALGAQQPRFAASVATALIGIGVRCVVVAGWAIDDDGASVFATAFYQALMRGERFMDAVGQARKETWKRDRDGNTWAAYQCYGDPNWVYRRELADDGAVSADHGNAGVPSATQREVVSPVGLAIELESIAVDADFDTQDRDGPARRAARLQTVCDLEALHAAEWAAEGAVAEAFGLAYAATGSPDDAIRWYRVAVAAADGSAQMRAAEQLANNLARRAEQGAAAKATKAQKDAAREEIAEATRLLDRLVAIQPTVERLSLLGSACKRLALVEGTDSPPGRKAAEDMAGHYLKAQHLAVAAGADNPYYPLLNRLCAELVLHGGDGWSRFGAEDLATLRQSLARKAADDPDFWSVVNAIELEAYEAVAAGRLKAALAGLLNRLDDTRRRVPSVGKWQSVEATARFTLGGWGDGMGPGAEEERRAMKELLARLAAFAATGAQGG